jgi:hypothetical protein
MREPEEIAQATRDELALGLARLDRGLIALRAEIDSVRTLIGKREQGYSG